MDFYDDVKLRELLFVRRVKGTRSCYRIYGGLTLLGWTYHVTRGLRGHWCVVVWDKEKKCLKNAKSDFVTRNDGLYWMCSIITRKDIA